jgi:hypothetical protein
MSYPKHILFEENASGESLYLLVEREGEALYAIGEDGC